MRVKEADMQTDPGPPAGTVVPRPRPENRGSPSGSTRRRRRACQERRDPRRRDSAKPSRRSRESGAVDEQPIRRRSPGRRCPPATRDAHRVEQGVAAETTSPWARHLARRRARARPRGDARLVRVGGSAAFADELDRCVRGHRSIARAERGGGAAIARHEDDRLGPPLRRQRARREGRRVGERPVRGSQGRGERRRHRAERRDRDQRSRRFRVPSRFAW
jgi:hypothetical protein